MGIGWIINIVFIGTMSTFPTSGQSETPAVVLWQELVRAANGHIEDGNYGSAEESLIRALRLAKSLGPESPRVAATLNNLALVSEKLGRYIQRQSDTTVSPSASGRRPQDRIKSHSKADPALVSRPRIIRPSLRSANQMEEIQMKTFGKQLIAVALVSVLGVLFGGFGRVAVSDPLATTAPELEGTWRVVVTQSGSAPFVAFAFHTFMRGGAMLETNQFDGAVNGGLRQMPSYGVWRRTGSHTFNHTFEKLQSDTAGNFVARVKIREMIELNSKLDSYSGVATVNVFDPSGNLLFSSCATTQATRMVPEPPSCP